MKAQRLQVTEFGTGSYPDPCKTILGRFMSLFTTKEFTDNDNVQYIPIGDEIYVATETGHIRRMDPVTLDTYERVELEDYIAVNTATAHPHIEQDGTIINMGSGMMPSPKYHVIKMLPEDNPFHSAKIVASITPSCPLNPAYYHSFCLTENYYIFIEQSLRISMLGGAKNHLQRKAFASCLRWRDDLPVRYR